MIDYKSDPNYDLAHTAFAGTDKEVKFYVPKDMYNGYHMSRKIAGEVQERYGAAGINKEILSALFDEMEKVLNSDDNTAKVRTSMALLVANGKYRLKYPVDELCAVRMAALFLFIEGEDPNMVHAHVTNKKVQIAMDCPNTYAFFLTIGEELYPSWKQSSESLKDEDYIKAKTEMLNLLRVKS